MATIEERLEALRNKGNTASGAAAAPSAASASVEERIAALRAKGNAEKPASNPYAEIARANFTPRIEKQVDMTPVYEGVAGLRDKFDLNSGSRVVRSINDAVALSKLEKEREEAEEMVEVYGKLFGSHTSSPEEKAEALKQKNRFTAQVEDIDRRTAIIEGNTRTSPYQKEGTVKKKGSFGGFMGEKALSGAAETVEGVTNALGYLGQLDQRAQGVRDAVQTQSYGDALALLGIDRLKEIGAQQLEEAKDAVTEEVETVADFGNKYARKVDEKYGTAGRSKFGQFAGNVAQGIGGMVPAIAANAIIPGSSLAVMGIGAMGNATQEAKAKGADDVEAMAYGVTVGAVETVTEKIFGGMGGAFGKGALDDVAKKLISKAVKNGAARAGLHTIVAFSAEGIEEFVAEFGNKLADKLTVKQDARSWGETTKDAFYSGLVGGTIGAFMNVGNILQSGQELSIEEAAEIAATDAAAVMNEAAAVPPLTKDEEAEQAEPITEEVGRVPGLPTIASIRAQAEAIEARRAELEKARGIAEKLGVSLREESLGEGHHGHYENGVITVNSDSDNPVLETFVHELTHHLESSGNYEGLRKAALDYVSGNMQTDVDSVIDGIVAEYAKGGIELDRTGAERELVAKFCAENVFTDEASIMRLARTDRNLFQRIYDWICDTITKLRSGADARALIDARRKYEKALRTLGETQSGVKHLYGGENAKNADLRALSEARSMEAQGMNGDEIRQKTGWFRGADNKWRFEIDDNGMEYNRQGFSENPDILRRRELESRLLSGEISDAEFEELRNLTAATKGVPKASKLGDYIKHDELFENYPQLRNAALVFGELPEGVKGRYNPDTNTITLSEAIRREPERVLIHEIQHAVQNVEGFSPGTNRVYWQNVLERDEQIYSKGMNESLNRLAQFEAENREAVAMAERIDEALRSDDDGAEYEAALEEAEERGLMDAVMEYDELRSEFYAQKARPGNRVPSELYRDTAGEIEARDAARRAGYTSQQRRETAPDIGNEDTVFAEGARLSEEYIPGDISQEETEEGIETVANMDTVAEVVGTEFAKGEKDLATQVAEFFDSVGNQVFNPQLGDVELTRRGVKDDIAHGIGRKKAAAFAAVPDVLQQGRVIDFRKNWKGRGYDTAVVAAPITIANEPYIMGVILERSNDSNRFYVHEVLIENGASPFKTGAPKGLPGGDAPSLLSLLQKVVAVKQNGASSSDKQASYGGSLAEQVKKVGGKPNQKKSTEYRSTIAKRDLRRDLLGLFSVGEGSRAPLGSIIDSYADRIIKNGEISVDDRQWLFDALYESGVMTVMADEYSSIGRDMVKDGRIYVNESNREEFGDDWAAFRRRAFGAGVYLTSNKADRGPDSWYTELSDSLPGLFDAGETDARTMLESIVRVAEDGKAQQMSLPDYTAMVAKQEHVSEAELIEHMERQVDWALRSFGEKAGLELWFKAKMDEKVQAEREKNYKNRQEQMQRQRENRELRELQQRTLKQLQWLSKNRHKAPQDLQAAWDEVLGDIDIYAINAANEMRWSEKHQATWKDLAQLYQELQDTKSPRYDPNFRPSKELQMIASRVYDKKIGDLEIDDLYNLYKMAVGLRTELYNRQNVLNDENHRLFSEVYHNAKAEIEGSKLDYRGNPVDRVFNEDQLTPMNVLQRMAGWNPKSTWYEMAKQLEQGERDMRRYKVKAAEALEGFLIEHEDWVRKADGQGKDAVWYEVEVPKSFEYKMGDKPIFGENVKVYMTPAQKVQLYLESKNNDNLAHIEGGRTFVDKEIYSKGDRQEALSHGTTIRMLPETVKKIVSDLTPEEMELAGILERYYNETAAEEINRVSNILYGYDKAVNKNYAPIYTNKNYTHTEAGVYDVTAEGVGNMKNRTQGAKNPSYNISAFDAFERHTDQTARFVGMSIPARNWNILLNWRESDNSMADVITHKWGERYLDYIKETLTNLQSGKSIEKTMLGKAADKLMNNYISSVFGFNPSIVLKQFGSMAMAQAELGVRNAPTPGQIAKIDKDLISKYTSELKWRGMGYATPETKVLKENPNWTERTKPVKFLFGGGAITAADQAAAGVLWPWAENKVRRENPELDVGTQEQIDAGQSPFYRKVASVFNDAVNRSQSVSDEMHQSSMRKDHHNFVRALTMFKSDSAQGYNQLRQKIGEARYLKKNGGDAKEVRDATRAAGEAVLGILVNNAWAVGVTFGVALLKNGAKNYRDDEDELTAESVTTEMAVNLAEGLSGLVIGGEELAGMIGNVITGDKWYGIDAPGLEQIVDLGEMAIEKGGAALEFWQGLGNVAENGGNVWEYISSKSSDIIGGIKEVASTAAAYLGGVPTGNIEAYLLGIVKAFSPELATAYEDVWQEVAKDDLKGLEGDALEQRLGAVIDTRVGEVSEDSIGALARLYEAGYATVVPSVPTSFDVDGATMELNAYQLQLYDKAWRTAVGDNLEEIVGSGSFDAADDKGKAGLVGKLYDYAAAKAKSAVSGDYEPDSWVAKVDAAVASGLELSDAIAGLAAASSAVGSKDETGETISGSKKLDVMQNIDALDLSAAEKQELYVAMGYDGEESMWHTEYEGDDYESYYYLSNGAKTDYNSWCSWMEVSDFAEYYAHLSSLTSDKDANGKTVSGSLQQKRIDYIDSLDLWPDEKSALFRCFYDAKSSLSKCIWYNPIAMTGEKFPSDWK